MPAAACACSEIGFDRVLMRQVKGEDIINLSQGERWEILADLLGGRAVSETLDDGLDCDPRLCNANRSLSGERQQIRSEFVQAHADYPTPSRLSRQLLICFSQGMSNLWKAWLSRIGVEGVDISDRAVGIG